MQRIIFLYINRLQSTFKPSCRLWQRPATNFAKVIYLYINALTSNICQIAEISGFSRFGQNTQKIKKR